MFRFAIVAMILGSLTGPAIAAETSRQAADVSTHNNQAEHTFQVACPVKRLVVFAKCAQDAVSCVDDAHVFAVTVAPTDLEAGIVTVSVRDLAYWRGAGNNLTAVIKYAACPE